MKRKRGKSSYFWCSKKSAAISLESPHGQLALPRTRPKEGKKPGEKDRSISRDRNYQKLICLQKINGGEEALPTNLLETCLINRAARHGPSGGPFEEPLVPPNSPSSSHSS